MGQIIAALDLGTSKSIAIVAKKDYLDKVSVLHTETVLSNQAIRRGRVYNLDGTADIISKLIWKLKNNSSCKIEKIHVGIGGQSLHTQLVKVNRTVENGTVNQQLLDSIKEEVLGYNLEFEDNLGIISCEYYADGQSVSNPKGTIASVIEAHCRLMVGNPCLKLNLEKVLGKNEINVANYFISPLAAAEAVLTREEKESGCALVEFGDGVTYVSVYKNKVLKYMTTLPLGGSAITKDIRSLNVSEAESEMLKIKYGSVVAGSSDGGEVPVTEGQNLSRKIDLRDLNWIIEARVDEIVKNVWNQIQISGYSQTIDAGIVITGGGASLKNLPQFIRSQTGKEVRLAKAKVWINQVETQLPPANSCVVGLAVLGKENSVRDTLSKGRDQSFSIFTKEERKKEDKIIEKKEEKKVETVEEKKPEKKPESRPLPFAGTFRRIKGKIKDTIEGGVIIFKDEDFDDNKNDNTGNNNATKK